MRGRAQTFVFCQVLDVLGSFVLVYLGVFLTNVPAANLILLFYLADGGQRGLSPSGRRGM